MRNRFALFGVFGLIATAVDLGLFLALEPGFGLLAADGIALASSALIAYCLNRFITFRASKDLRWVSAPILFAITAFVAGVVDVILLFVLDRTGMSLLVAKLVAIAAGAAYRWYSYRRILFTQIRTVLAQRVRRPAPLAQKRLAIVIPAFNEGDRIASTVQAIRHDVTAEVDPGELDIIVVDDGSNDKTAEIAERAGATVVRQPENRGKGAAVRAGVGASRAQYVVFTDADLAYPPKLILAVLDELEQGWDMVVGSRRHDETKTLVKARKIRQIGGRLVNRLTHLVLLGQFRDTQCGLKGLRGDIGRTLFARTKIDGFAFDVELFLMAEQDSLSLLEIPVSVENRPGSSVQLIVDTWRLLVDLFRIRVWASQGGYLPNAAQQQVLSARARRSP